MIGQFELSPASPFDPSPTDSLQQLRGYADQLQLANTAPPAPANPLGPSPDGLLGRLATSFYNNYLHQPVTQIPKMTQDLVTDPLLFLHRAAPTLGGLGMAVPVVRVPTPPENALASRMYEIARALDIRARRHRTTAVLGTDAGTIVGSGGRDLTLNQRAMLLPDEIAAILRGAHSERKLLLKAQELGQTPQDLVAYRKFCPYCIKLIESYGGVLTRPFTATFPPK